MLSMLATLAFFYVAGRHFLDFFFLCKLWIQIMTGCRKQGFLDKRSWIEGLGSNISGDTLKIIACREQKKKLSALEMELAASRQEGFVSNRLPEKNSVSKRRPLVVIGILMKFSRKSKRDAIRKAWMGSGRALKKMEDEKEIIAHFVIGRISDREDSLDRSIDSENKQTDDFLILENRVEAPAEHPKKIKLFLAHPAENWDADFFAKVNDDVYLNIDKF